MVQEQLISYIKEELAAGISESDIRTALLASNWTDQDISDTFQNVHEQQPPAAQTITPPITQRLSLVTFLTLLKGMNKRFLGFIVLALLFCLLVVVGSLLLFKSPQKPPFGGTKLFSHWVAIAGIPNKECNDLAISKEKLFISCTDHLYKSFDYGKTFVTDEFWDTLNNNPRMIGSIPLTDFPSQLLFDKTGNTVYAGSFTSGIYRSWDQGKTWQPINKGVRTQSSERDGVGVADLLMSPSNNTILYTIAGDYTLLQSINAGDSWQTMQGFTNLQGLVIDPHDPNHLFLSYGKTISSHDGGKTLITGSDTFPEVVVIKSAYIDPNDTKHIIVAGVGGIFSSVDEGQHWTSLSNGLKGRNIPTSQISEFSNSFAVLDILGTEQKYIVSMAVNPRDSNVIAIGTETSGIFVTTNGGKSWLAVNKGLVLADQNKDSFIITQKVVWSEDGKQLYLLSNHGVYMLE